MSPIAKLVVSKHGTACAVNNVCVVVDESTPHTNWSLKKHDPN